MALKSYFVIPTVDIEVYCRTCGCDLKVIYNENKHELEVDPCPDCLKEDYERGLNEGREEE